MSVNDQHKYKNTQQPAANAGDSKHVSINAEKNNAGCWKHPTCSNKPW